MGKTVVIGYDIKSLSDDYVYEFDGLSEREIKGLIKHFAYQEMKKHRFWEREEYTGEHKDNVKIYLKEDYEKKGNI